LSLHCRSRATEAEAVAADKYRALGSARRACCSLMYPTAPPAREILEADIEATRRLLRRGAQRGVHARQRLSRFVGRRRLGFEVLRTNLDGFFNVLHPLT
jgi:3-oxoacyl-[acyl-carrier protein] reductase